MQPETGESLVFFFKTLIQLFVLRWFLYSLDYCIKEVIKGKIFWILNEKKCWPMRQLRPETGESLEICLNTLIQLYLFCLFLYF